MNRDYLTTLEVTEMHRLLIEQFGGSHGIREVGALESAVLRPQMGYYNDLIQEAAAMMESLAMNHPFIDGNKRIAFFATDVFLRINGHFIDCDNAKAYQDFMEMFERDAFSFHNLEAWLRGHVEPLA